MILFFAIFFYKVKVQPLFHISLYVRMYIHNVRKKKVQIHPNGNFKYICMEKLPSVHTKNNISGPFPPSGTLLALVCMYSCLINIYVIVVNYIEYLAN